MYGDRLFRLMAPDQVRRAKGPEERAALLLDLSSGEVPFSIGESSWLLAAEVRFPEDESD
jgi:hypothetical protein